jgi:endoglucanase
MKNLIRCLLVVSSFGLHAQEMFTKGVNLTGWFQAPSPRQMQFSKYTKKDFERIKSLGADAIRLPVNLHAMTNGAPDYILDPLFLEFLDEVVNWSEELQISLIIDNHTFDVNSNTDPSIVDVLVKVWKQMAAHYKSRSGYLYFEVLNEPHGISDAVWAGIQQSVIDAIRTEDTSHYIIVGGANWNNYNSLSQLPVYTDTKLIYTFHFYDPFLFTHQGASWTNPSMVPLGGVPFPYRASDMPVIPATLKGTWIESSLNNYSNDGTVAKVKSLIDIAVNFKNTRNVPVFCGEFGVYIPNSGDADRVYWYEVVRRYLEEKQIPWTIWDYQGGFGLFEKDSNELFDYDLNVTLLGSLGMNIPPQQVYIKRPITNSFIVFDDYIQEGIINASYTNTGTIDFYNTTSPQQGAKCIYWSNVNQYQSIAFDFKPNIDLSLLPSNDYVLEFWVKGSTPDVKFDVRFIDSKVSTTDRPWRKGKTIEPSMAVWDGTWKKISIPLSALEDKGAYDNGWIPPPGNFDWKNIDRFEIVAEHQALTGIEFWFDDIRVTGEEIPYEDPVLAVEEETGGFKIYPNPMNEQVTIRYTLKEEDFVTVNIYTLQGQLIQTLSSGSKATGNHWVQWEGTHANGTHLPAGMYLVSISTQHMKVVRKVMKLF